MTGIPVLHCFLEFAHSCSLSLMPSNHLILCHPLLPLPSIFPRIRAFSSKLALCIKWPKYWSFSVSPSSEYSGLISFRVDWFDFFAVQGTLKSPFQHHIKSICITLQNLYAEILTANVMALGCGTFF